MSDAVLFTVYDKDTGLVDHSGACSPDSLSDQIADPDTQLAAFVGNGIVPGSTFILSDVAFGSEALVSSSADAEGAAESLAGILSPCDAMAENLKTSFSDLPWRTESLASYNSNLGGRGSAVTLDSVASSGPQLDQSSFSFDIEVGDDITKIMAAFSVIQTSGSIANTAISSIKLDGVNMGYALTHVGGVVTGFAYADNVGVHDIFPGSHTIVVTMDASYAFSGMIAASLIDQSIGLISPSGAGTVGPTDASLSLDATAYDYAWILYALGSQDDILVASGGQQVLGTISAPGLGTISLAIFTDVHPPAIKTATWTGVETGKYWLILGTPQPARFQNINTALDVRASAYSFGDGRTSQQASSLSETKLKTEQVLATINADVDGRAEELSGEAGHLLSRLENN